MTSIAVVILNWNGVGMMEKYLRGVIGHSCGEAQVIVADNASTDGSVEWLHDTFPEVRVIQLDQNWGFAEGYNKALQQVDAEYYVLLNSDVEVTPHWLTPLKAFMDSHPTVAACQPKLLAMADRDKFEYAGAAGGFIDWLGYPFCRGRLFETVEHDKGQYDSPRRVMWATGACMMIRSADYWAAGGLDARFFAHNEEIDLCWRLWLLGREVWCVTDSHVFHVGGGTLNKENPRKTYFNFRNNLTMLYKNLPDNKLKTVMRWRWLLDRVAALQFLLKGKRGDCRAIMRARRDFKQWKSEYADVHHAIRSTAVAEPPQDVMTPHSLLISYYLRGKKTFNKIM